ncbi:MAG: tRNA (adenosine(37)-N6)-threonylcarbamoyltransferase complex dimerization subunit type 1 TsaB [Candidatus Symbiobacter sp.]|nr:tRNA (adenosine(37)-N6)-threonylcarbamoyltransferase complex dimerization subunit type 1 TsaB [Candidatus Symbiobacter sp.]
MNDKTCPHAEKILLIDCSGRDARIGICVGAGGDAPPQLENSQLLAVPPGRSEQIVTLLEQAMSGQEFSELAAIAVTVGPGSFTGIRVGLALAMGVAAAWDLPLFGLSWFEVGRWQIMHRPLLPPLPAQNLPFLVLVESRRHSLYRQIFTSSGDILAKADEISYDQWHDGLAAGKYLVTGTGVNLMDQNSGQKLGIMAEIPPGMIAPWPSLAAWAWQTWAWQTWHGHRQGGNLPGIAPLYIRPADVTLAPVLAPLTAPQFAAHGAKG